MTIFTLSLQAIQSIATLKNVMPRTKAEQVKTPTLYATEIVVTREHWSAVASDRYLVAEVSDEAGSCTHTLHGEPDSELKVVLTMLELERCILTASIEFPGALAEHVWVTFVVEGEGCPIIVQIGGSSFVVEQPGASFPSLRKLFEEVDNTPRQVDWFAVDAAMLSRISKVRSVAQLKLSVKEVSLIMQINEKYAGSGLTPTIQLFHNTSSLDVRQSFRGAMAARALIHVNQP